MRRRDKNSQSIRSRKSILIFFLIIIPILMCFVSLGLQYHIFIMIGDRTTGAALDVSEAENISMLGTVMTTISIAVSVWIGLNIYNVYRKEDLDSALEIMQNSLDDLNYEGEKRKLIWQLERGEYMYEINKYFCIELEKENIIPCELIKELANFEKQFYWCYTAYEKDRWGECAELAGKLLVEIKSIERMLKRLFVNEETVLYSYVHIRMADLHFYKNRTGNVVDIEEYKESIELYEEELKDIPDSANELRGYMENTIGYTYILLLQMPNKLKNSISQKESKKTSVCWGLKCIKAIIKRWEKEIEKQEKGTDMFENVIDDYKKRAKEYMEKAVKDNPKGRYWQNFGSYYEMIEKDYDEAIKKYLEASRAEKKDEKIYNLLGAVLLKKVDQTLGIDRRFDDKDECGNKKETETLADIAEKLRKNNDTKQKVKEDIKEAYDWLHFALKQNEPVKNAYYNYSKACFYYYLFVADRKGKNIDKLNEAEKYLKMIKTYYEKGEKQDNRVIGMLYTYRNFYEAKEDYDNALRENNKLVKYVGENNKEIQGARKLYERKITPKGNN
ncbi:MAG: tetratricopeptide repeat protein [Lachnospiraceae bacterium]